MGDAGSLDRVYAFQFELLRFQMIEQPDAATEQDGRDVDIDFINELGLEGLLQDTGSGDDNIFVSRCFLGLTNCAFNTIRNKGERRAFFDPFLRDGMGNNKGW